MPNCSEYLTDSINRHTFAAYRMILRDLLSRNRHHI